MPPPLQPDAPEDDRELFWLFRVLRERVFAGSGELVSRVMRTVEDRLHAPPAESMAGTILVQLTNFATSWMQPAADHAPLEDGAPPPTGAPNTDDGHGEKK